MKTRTLHAPKRVFVGIKLTPDRVDAFLDLQSSLGELPGKFIPPKDIHLTLVPPFETRDIVYTIYVLRKALAHAHRFKIRFLRLDYGPDRERPMLAWVECGATAELVSLKKKLLRAFGKKEKVPFIPHMTLARFKKRDAEQIAHHPIRRLLRLSMNVETVELFESPHRGGAGYTVLSSVSLQPKDGVPIWHGS